MNFQHAPLSPTTHQRHYHGINHLKLPGRDGYGKVAFWVPYDKLLTYWGSDRMDEILYHLMSVPPIAVVRDKYLRVFTILVLLNKVQYMNLFTSHGLTDDYWPQTEPYSQWSDSLKPFFDEFLSQQWTFFPLDMYRHNLVDRNIPPERILPFENIQALETKVNKGEAVKVAKVTIFEPMNEDEESRNRKKGTYLLKTYNLENEEPEGDYQRENDAYTLMESLGPSDNLVRFGGSFQQSNTGNLLLEYVDGGTLWDYLHNTPKPQTPGEKYEFWRSVSGLANWLRIAHQVTAVSSPPLPRRGIIHQDLKFDNILLDMKNSPSRYRFHTKVIDLGHSSVGTAQGEKLVGQDNHGNAMYSPPEATHHFDAIEFGPDLVSSAHDIWALGCIYLQLAAWVVEGFSSILTLGAMRKEELAHHPRFNRGNSGNAFHNGANLLQSIQRYHDLIVSQITSSGRSDEITTRILDIVMEHMLNKEPHRRMEAKQVYLEIDNILCKLGPEVLQEDTGPPSTALARPSRPTHARSDPSPPSSAETPLTIDQCIEDRHACKMKLQRNPDVCSKVEKLRTNLNFRDHLFLIDDSPSMKKHLGDIVRAFTALSYVVKPLDRDGIELAFISSPQVVTRNKKTARLIELVQGHSYDSNSELMEDKLGKFLQEAVVSKLPHLTRYISLWRRTPLTVIVFTDGSWGADQDHAAGVQNPVIDLMQTMRSRGVARTNVTIQFLRFGDDHFGKGYLSYLDKMGQKDNQDIVDTRTIEDNVVDILMSSISTVRDQNNNATERSRSSTL